MTNLPLGTALGYFKYPANKNASVQLFCHEGFDQIKPEEIEITIKPTETHTLHGGVTHKVNNHLISSINVDDFDFYTGGLKIHSLADKHIGQFIQIRIEASSLIITGIEIEIKPNYWCPDGAKFEIPREGPLTKGITIGIEFRRHINRVSHQIEIQNRNSSNDSRSQE